MNPPPLFTVSTPTFNRAGLLPRVYLSLLAQTFSDFEWLVIDDGSSDDTGDLVRGWAASAPFPIRYVWKENGGKHSAHNLSVREARGKLFVMIDSDDWMLPEALEVMESAWRDIETREDCSGVCCLFQYEDGVVVGDRFPQHGMESNAIDLRFNLEVSGDKMGFTRTDILRRFLFPEDLGRNLVPESLVWNRIAQEYQMPCLNTPVGVKEYQQGGLTDLSMLNAFRNPEAYYRIRLELLNGRVPLPPKAVFRLIPTFAKCAILAGRSPFALKNPLHRCLVLGALPAGGLLALRDYWRARVRDVSMSPRKSKSAVRMGAS